MLGVNVYGNVDTAGKLKILGVMLECWYE
jgi:hypothetical protein